MPSALFTAVPLADWAAIFMLVVARLSPVIILMPGIGEQVVPIRIRIQVLVAIAFLFTASGLIEPVSFNPFGSYLALMLGEALFGILLGISLRVAIWVLSIAGSVIAMAVGISQMLGVAMENESNALTANLLTMAGAALLLSANFHVYAVASFIDLYKDVPPGQVADFDYAFVASNFFQAFNLAILLAWPFIAVNLLYNICLGFINKALPQLMVAFVGAPFMVGAGIFLLTVAIATLLLAWQSRAPQLMGWM